ncbi:MAG: RCC1 domain-containing protein, partial [Anaerolineae bacterium]
MVHARCRIKVEWVLALLLIVCLALSPASAALNPEEGPAGSPWRPGTIAIGTQHACAIRSNGTVACWGWCGAEQCTPPEGTF